MHIRTCTLALALCFVPSLQAPGQEAAASAMVQPSYSFSPNDSPTSTDRAESIQTSQEGSAAPSQGAATSQDSSSDSAKSKKKNSGDQKTGKDGSTGQGPATKDVCTDSDNQPVDCRDNFEADAYVGVAIDTFAAGELNKYFNPDDANKIKVRGVGGIDFAYRMYNGPCSDSDKRPGSDADKDGGSEKKSKASKLCEATDLSHPQLWVYGETVHGARSADVDCKANPNLSVCSLFLNNPTFSPDQTLYLLRNATSLEAYAGARAEFYTLARNSKSPANLYLKTEAGFLTVAGAGKLTPNHTAVALGLITTSGRFHESFLDVGYGRTKLFARNSNSRWKIHGYMTWNAFTDSLGRYVRPYTEMTVDTDLGPGSDSVQSYFGINFDLDCIFNPKYCKNEGKAAGSAKGQ